MKACTELESIRAVPGTMQQRVIHVLRLASVLGHNVQLSNGTDRHQSEK